MFAKINDDSGNPHSFNSNKEFVVNLLIDCIRTLFPNLNKVQIEAFVLNLFNNSQDWHQFKSTLRDLLISMKSFASNDDEFYNEEKKVSNKVSFNSFIIGCYGRSSTKGAPKKKSHSRSPNTKRVVIIMRNQVSLSILDITKHTYFNSDLSLDKLSKLSNNN